MSSAHDLTLTHHTGAEAVTLMDELCDVYADAYGAVPGEDTRVKSGAFRERATSARQGVNYSLVTAHVGDQLVGFAFGYSLRPERGVVGRAPATASTRVHRRDRLSYGGPV